MKKFLFLFIIFLCCSVICAQRNSFKGRVFDGITFYPVEEANIFNVSRSAYTFSDKDGNFEISCKLGDTIILSKSIYRQLIVVMDAQLMDRGSEDFFLYYKAILLKEVNVISLNPTYEGFKRDMAKIELPDAYKKIKGTEISDMDKANAEYKIVGPNMLKYAGNVAHPITALYNAFSKKAKMQRLYYEMLQYEDILDEVPLKYNKDIVRQETGLPEEEIMSFMMFCHFSYYDLVRWTPTQIINYIHEKYTDYEYYKLNKSDK